MGVGLRDLFKTRRLDGYDAVQEAAVPAPAGVDLDRMLVAELRRFGLDLALPRDARFFLYFHDEVDADRAAEEIAAEGYEASVEAADGERSESWRVVASRDMVVDDATIADARLVFGRIAVANWGSFGGWEAAASD